MFSQRRRERRGGWFNIIGSSGKKHEPALRALRLGEITVVKTVAQVNLDDGTSDCFCEIRLRLLQLIS